MQLANPFVTRPLQAGSGGKRHRRALTAPGARNSHACMRYYTFLICGSLLSLAACAVPTDTTNVASAIAALSPADAVGELVALASDTSAGGASLTAAEAAAYVARVPLFSAEASIDALAITARFNDDASRAELSPVIGALRAHVETVRISGLRVAGLTIETCGGASPVATFDPEGGAYTNVSLVYTRDNWATKSAAKLARSADGIFRSSLAGVNATDRSIKFAVTLTGAGGSVEWLNNPRESANRASAHLDYEQNPGLCAATDAVVTPSTPHLARYVRAFAKAESLGGATVTWDEMSALVAYTTYEGGPGMDDVEIIDPALSELDRMAAEGIAFEADTLGVMQRFLSQMRMRIAQSSSLRFARTDTGTVLVTPSLAEPVTSMLMYYSTDGWNTTKTASCFPSVPVGASLCELGYLPRGTFVAYSAAVRFASGRRGWIRAEDGGNLFHKVN
jgi:hypothetical protein